MVTIFLAFNLGNTSVSDFFLELANRLAKDYRVVIFSTPYNMTISGLDSNIKVHIWPSPRPTKFKDFIFLIKLVKFYRPKIMIAIFGAVNLFVITGILLRVKHRIVWARTISTAFPSTKYLRIRKGFLYKMATLVIANSKATKQDLIKNFRVSPSRILMIYNAVKDYRVKQSPTENNKIIYVGRLHASKGVKTLLNAMALVLKSHPKTELHLYGGNLNGNELLTFKTQAKNLNIEEKIFFYGNQPKSTILNELSKAYITIVPSIVEAFGFVVIESFSVKTPVIGSRTTGIMEIIRDSEDGFLFETGNAEDLAFKILEIIKNPELRETFSNNCYLRFCENFELNVVINDLYKKIDELS